MFMNTFKQLETVGLGLIVRSVKLKTFAKNEIKIKNSSAEAD